MSEKYTPSSDLLAALEELDRLKDLVTKQTKAVHLEVANDLKANPELTNADVAEHEAIPYTQETVRKIAREYGVPRKRQPTVRAIKPKKRA
ncbi:hypothetical protein [Streptomyces sp. NE06-03C]|uniref:hypothetical protein n=1 Tax=Streptomyces sp. NE06-03C TaxID=3028694 RepID=UPI0029B36DEE|nr:hypothetical protein [Streptomyces sp. NE06-03C]MDX2922479.1 hypothetical protein [Streptomyces sp. NE06-03C]